MEPTDHGRARGGRIRRGPAPRRRTGFRDAALALAGLSLVTVPSANGWGFGASGPYSPRNRERPRRASTEFIVLHTTEGPSEGSLRKVHENGEAHYFIDTLGRVSRIIDSARVALHCGRSLWDGKPNLDACAIGIEVAGYHNQDIRPAQYAALKDLLAQVRKVYRVPDERVLTHSMVAYGAPNRWHHRSHRGRKRCAMLFAQRSVRLKLGLTRQPVADPDVKAGRLVVGDPYLASALYGSAREQEAAAARFASQDAFVISAGRSAWDVAGDKYASAGTVYTLPDGRQLRGDEITDWEKLPRGTRVALGADQSENEPEIVKTIGRDGNTARDIAGEECNQKTTVYFLLDGRVKQGHQLTEEELAALPAKTRVLVGYVHGGLITAKRAAYDVCGRRWNLSSTFYRLPDGTIKPGNEMREDAIPRNAMVFFQE